MPSSYYEIHNIKNSELPIIFHRTHLEKKTSHLYYTHWHENIELLFVTEGILRVYLDGTEVLVPAGDVAVVNSGVLHAMTAHTPATKYFCLIIDSDFCKKHGFFIEEKKLCEVTNAESVAENILRIDEAYFSRPPYYEEDILSDVTKILVFLFRFHTKNDLYSGTHKKSIEVVKSGINYIKKHFREHLTIDEIAAHTGYSKFYFCHCFKELTGSTLGAYINKYRSDYAYTLLTHTDMSIGSIAAECGFEDVSYFTKVFKKNVGVLPSHIRKKE